MPRRVVELGVRGRIGEEELEELLSGFEEVLRRGVTERLRRRLRELDILVEGEVAEDGTLRVRVDVSARGLPVPPLTYDEVLAEAIREAEGWLESELRARVAGRGGGKAHGDA